MINKADLAPVAWVEADEAAYRTIFAPDARLFMPAFGGDNTGCENVWAVRRGLTPAPVQHTVMVQA